ncbi:hypothetical protein SAMN04515667_1932 [Formosa sp. Hel1_31_208]|uniref:hypothetical protein n=1 Tax=Formosa sp. Hel1_31_208 TaxID=1798225 RepID=UPI00087DD225|nr:hypothetical protein [Formosa sp. Hel1_31_208]SDS33074.1 hypothetical protein SAMN04515667_1932 [Formosa sp. Hel1_31_208]
MSVFLRKYELLLITIFLLSTAFMRAQSYRKDSLQIKSYTLIEYQNNEVKDIQLLKVICDYCTDFQKKAIGEEAKRRAFQERLDPKNRVKDGKKKLAIYIRIAKTDFAEIKEN